MGDEKRTEFSFASLILAFLTIFAALTVVGVLTFGAPETFEILVPPLMLLATLTLSLGVGFLIVPKLAGFYERVLFGGEKE